MSENQTPEQKPAKPKSARRRAREFAVQGVYQWLLTGETAHSIDRFLHDSSTSYGRADAELLKTTLFGAIKEAETLKTALRPHVDRPMDEVSPVECAVLLVAGFEIVHMPETPYPVIINEAIELAKTFGGVDGHKFVNGVLDRLASHVREEEFVSLRQRKPRSA
ncbi:transcription antitermination factor NusB [Chitinilyticum piscinae]|uniref:Transcription antitermination protein NusB n=1 Tax=Chitinilyticum piscinae TaxID=2866724 RepID=A0A8J7FLS4_9NEIS|nr:transcription antitermination factor NusB [Chitinilyticum piscinae]MBE9608671.1 transcription antitermination factor NusB [Chitinilyticum piscinae]